jgi:hypothetical protein
MTEMGTGRGTQVHSLRGGLHLACPTDNGKAVLLRETGEAIRETQGMEDFERPRTSTFTSIMTRSRGVTWSNFLPVICKQVLGAVMLGQMDQG